MELEGETLVERLRRSELDLEEALAMAARLLGALAEAHALGVVHRDVEPASIFLIDALAGSATLLDFGLARRSGGSGARGQRVAMPGYVAPELVRGEAGDARTDIYSVGAVLFRCLTGRVVVEDESTLDALVRVARDGAPSLGDSRPDLPVALTALVDRMLAREPIDRPGTASEVLDEIRVVKASLSAADLLSHPGAEAGDPVTAAPLASPARVAFVPGEATGGSTAPGYRVGRLLGKGAMGQVHEAIRSPDGARFAAKILLGDGKDPQVRRGLVNEALAMADLHHPNIVEVIDLLEHPSLGVVLVTELVEGRSLLAASEEMGLDERLEIIGQVLTGLSEAHAQGVVHGDLKPGNILVSRSSIAKICDFGVAQILGATKDGGLRRINAGTPAFMAPEQFEEGTLQPRTDLYAVGVLLYEAIVGRQPWRGQSLARVYAEKLAGFEPPRVDALGRAIPARLTSLIAALCEPQLERRLRFAREALEILELARAELEPERARPRDELSSEASGRARRAVYTELLRSTALGKADAAPTTGAVGVDGGGGWFLPAGAGLLRAPLLFGRELELRVIRDKMREVAHSRLPQLIFVTGEGGIGKSRLGDWALAEAERSASFEGAAARFSADGTTPLRGLRGIVQRLLDSSGGARVKAAFDHLRAVGALTVACDDAAVTHWLATPADTFLLDASTAAGLALETIRSIAARRPVLLWLDDIAHSTDGAIELVRALLDSDDLPVLVIAASSEAELERSISRDRLFDLSQRATPLRLGPLSRDASLALLRSMVGADRDAASAATLDGVPHHVVALARDHLARAGVRAGDVDAGEASWERGAQGLVDRWLEPLKSSMGERFVLLLGSANVAGHLTTKLLRAMARELGLTETAADLAVDEALLGGVFAPDGGERFMLSSETLRARLQASCDSHREAARIHRSASAALIGTFGQDRPDVVAHAARLTHKAGDPHEACSLVFEAADVMAFGGDLASGRTYFSLGVAWLAPLGLDGRHPLTELSAYIEARLRYFELDYEGALDIVRPLLARVEAESPDSPIRLKAVRLVLRSLFYSDRFAACEAELTRVAPVLEVDPWGRAHVAHLRAHLLALRGDESGCSDVLEAALASANASCPEMRIVFSSELAELAASRGDTEAARRRLMDAELLVADVYEAIAVRQVRSTVLTLLGEGVDRRVWVDLWHSCLRRNDKWRSSAVSAQLALHDLGARHADLQASVALAVAAFEDVPHDEPPTHAALARLGASPDVPDALRARIAAALERRRAAAGRARA